MAPVFWDMKGSLRRFLPLHGAPLGKDAIYRNVSFFCHKSVDKSFVCYPNDPKFSDRPVWENKADPDQTAYGGAV